MGWQEDAIELARKKRTAEEKRNNEHKLGDTMVSDFWRQLVAANNQLPQEIRLHLGRYIQKYTTTTYDCLLAKGNFSEMGLMYKTNENTAQIRYCSTHDNKLTPYPFHISYNGNGLVGYDTKANGKFDLNLCFEINNSSIDILLRNLCLCKDISEGLTKIECTEFEL